MVSAVSDILGSTSPARIGSRESTGDPGKPLGVQSASNNPSRECAEGWEIGVCSGTARARTEAWDPEYFAEQQILSLLQRVFFPGWPRPSRQVLLSSVDKCTDGGTTCARVGLMMAKRLPATVCVIEADIHDDSLERALAHSKVQSLFPATKTLRRGHQVQDNLWFLSAVEFFEGQTVSLVSLRNRLGALRREFDYTVIHAPAVGKSSETELLGQIADGLILVLDERMTRRAIAREAREILRAANVRLLGVVINERQFPIPESVYRRL